MRRNLVTNPSLENGTSGWAPLVLNATLNDFSQSSVWRKAGDYSLHFSATTTGASATALVTPGASFPVTGGAWYGCGVELNLIAEPAAGCRLRVAWYDVALTPIGNSDNTTIALGEGRIKIVAQAPINAAFAAVIVGTISAATASSLEFYADAVILEEVASTTTANTLDAYFDGDYPGAYWAGLAHESASVYVGITEGSLVLADGRRAIDLVGTPPDGIYLTEFTPPIMARRDTYAQGADTDGRVRVRSQNENPVGSAKLRVDRSQEDTAEEFFDELDDLQELIESANRNKGTLRYKPPYGDAITFDLESVRLAAMPQLGTELNKRRTEPELEFECLPYGRLDPVTLIEGEALQGPIDSFDVEIPGQAEAFVELVLTDDSAIGSDHIEVGVEQFGYEPDDPTPLYIPGDDLQVASYAGSADTEAGSHSTTIVRATLAGDGSLFACGTGSQRHLGWKRVRARVKTDAVWTPTNPDSRVAGQPRVRLRYRVQAGDGMLATEAWKSVPVPGQWCDVDLGAIYIEPVPIGEHSWEGVIEVSGEVGATIAIDFVEVIPAEVYGKARGKVSAPENSALYAFDDFAQVVSGGSDPLTGLTAPSSQVWAALAGSDADDFVVEDTGHTAQRIATGDTNNLTGRYVTLGPTSVDQSVSATIKFSTQVATASAVRYGLLARAVDINNYLCAVFEVLFDERSTYMGISVYKRVAGTPTLLAASSGSPYLSAPNFPYRLALSVNDLGIFGVWLTGAESGLPGQLIASGGDAVLSTGQALDEGLAGLVDIHASGTACTRNYEDFNYSAIAPTISLRALNPNRRIRFTHNAMLREAAAGTQFSKVPIPEGQHLRLTPATRTGQLTRIAVKRRRFDVDAGFMDDGLADELLADVVAVPRVLLTGVR